MSARVKFEQISRVCIFCVCVVVVVLLLLLISAYFVHIWAYLLHILSIQMQINAHSSSAGPQLRAFPVPLNPFQFCFAATAWQPVNTLICAGLGTLEPALVGWEQGPAAPGPLAC